MMGRSCLLVMLATACASDALPPEDPPDLFDQVWGETIRPGDVIVAVPGTGGYTTLGVHIEERIDPAHPEAIPVFDGHDYVLNVQVLEEAIAAAQRAGFTDTQLEAGAVKLAMWGSGITKLAAFDYESLGGLRVRFDVVGGTSVCANGGIPENLANYNGGNAELDARDLYQRTQAWLGTHPGNGRNVVMVAHSWGGVVTEYVAKNLAQLEQDHGVLPGATVAYIVSGGVPGFLPGFAPLGPGFRTVESVAGDVTASVRTYEVDRPDDPVHTFNFTVEGGGHSYIIMIGDAYQGWYGITTDELSCLGMPGVCPAR